MSSELSSAFKQALKRPGFLAVLLVLLLGAVGINAATSALHLFFRKEPLALRSPQGLNALPTRIGDWIAVPDEHPLDADTEHSLNTDKYLFRDYVDLSAVSTAIDRSRVEAEIKAMGSLNDNEVNTKLNEFRRKNLNSVLRLAVTYYTGKVDTVPHVPERCMVADGFQPSKWVTPKWHLGDYSPGNPRDVTVRFIDFEDQTSRGAQNRCVTYFFHANGRYEEDPNEVRRRLQDLRTKYAYFAKIEVLTLLPTPLKEALDSERQQQKARDAAAEAVQRFLTVSLPEVEKLLPDPASVTR